MGWQSIFDKNGEKTGTVGDEAWDITEVTLNKLREKLNELYQKNFGKDINDIEFEQIVDFIMPTWDEYKKVGEKIEEITDLKEVIKDLRIPRDN